MTYNHAYTVGFSVSGSKDETGKDVTQQQMAIALLRRIADLLENNEMYESVGLPFDTYEE